MKTFNRICPDCGFDSDDRVEYANHRRDRHLAYAHHQDDEDLSAYLHWLEGDAAA